ncbi:MAG: chemotaxis protein CheW [Nitrosomonadales bacterium]|nr:chemotaxis protein CheW [Nitrosomonadales bacterium]
MDQNASTGFPLADGVGEWLSPSKALERFEPPSEMVLAAAVEEKRARYGFRISSLGILIKPGCNSEVLHKPDIWDLPGSSPWLLGLINLRSNLVPVFDLRQLFGLPQRDVAAPQLVLVLDQGDKAVGLLIDDFPKPLFDMSFLPGLPQLPEELQAHVRGGYMKGDGVWLEFDHESFFENLVRSEQ